ncbi:MAG: hypothetical protein ABI651_21990 [Verrucomicrobiota bacterium]
MNWWAIQEAAWLLAAKKRPISEPLSNNNLTTTFLYRRNFQTVKETSHFVLVLCCRRKPLGHMTVQETDFATLISNHAVSHVTISL